LGLEFPVPPTKVYSPECVEVEFCELRVDGVLVHAQAAFSGMDRCS
jgi:hypothetical protein